MDNIICGCGCNSWEISDKGISCSTCGLSLSIYKIVFYLTPMQREHHHGMTNEQIGKLIAQEYADRKAAENFVNVRF